MRAVKRAGKPAGYLHLPEPNQTKVKTRCLSNIAQSRGKLRPQPCRRCGAEPAEKHHLDYEKPLDVEWLCHPCHRQEHAFKI